MPLEAAQFGASVFASDIDVVHEVGGDEVICFSLLLAGCLRSVNEALSTERIVRKIDNATWRGSAVALMTMLRADAYQSTLD